MQALDLNLASRPFKNNTLLWVGFSAASLALVALTIDNVATRQSHVSMLTELEAKVGGIETRQRELRRRAVDARREIERYDVESLVMRTEKANEVIRWKSFSWTGLFNELEKTQPGDVQMSSIHPTFRPESSVPTPAEAAAGRGIPVVVDGTAKTLTAFLDFERALIQSRAFTRVEPERTDIDEQTRETIFALRFLYDPDAVVGPPPVPEVAAQSAAEGPAEASAEPLAPPGAEPPALAVADETGAPAPAEPAAEPAATEPEPRRPDPPRTRRGRGKTAGGGAEEGG